MHSPTSHVSQNHFVRWGSFLVLHWAQLRELPLFGMCEILSYLSPGATYGLNLLGKFGDFFALVGVFVLAPIRPATNDNLSPCDFDLIPNMKQPHRGIRFRTVPEILQAVDRSILTQQALIKVSYDFHIAGNGLYTMLVTTLKDSKTSKHVSILYQLQINSCHY